MAKDSATVVGIGAVELVNGLIIAISDISAIKAEVPFAETQPACRVKIGEQWETQARFIDMSDAKERVAELVALRFGGVIATVNEHSGQFRDMPIVPIDPHPPIVQEEDIYRQEGPDPLAFGNAPLPGEGPSTNEQILTSGEQQKPMTDDEREKLIDEIEADADPGQQPL